jgi:hypothetical protein
MIDLIKTRPLATASATISAVVAILGALWAFDSHYATAADLQDVKQTFVKQVTQMRADDLDDKIFALQLKQNKNGKLDPVDSAMLDRYTRQLQMIQDQLKTVPAK